MTTARGEKKKKGKTKSAPKSVAGTGGSGGTAAAGGAPRPVPRKADLVSRAILSDVVRGKFRVGSILPKEDALATRFGVNRGVVREAIKLLEVHGLVHPVRRRGTVVLDPRLSMSPEVLIAMLVPQRGRADVPMLRHFLEVRAVLDAEMTALATRRRKKEDLDVLTLIYEAMLRSPDDAVAFVDLQKEFGEALARATHNPVFPMFSAWNRRVLSEIDDALSLALPRPRENIEGLGILLGVIRRGDEAEARTLVAAYHAWLSPRLIAACTSRTQTKSRILKELL